MGHVSSEMINEWAIVAIAMLKKPDGIRKMTMDNKTY